MSSIQRTTSSTSVLADGSVTDAKVATNAAISADKLADGTTNHVFTATDDTKLTGVATGATANATDAQLRDRATHTGTQSADTLTDGTTGKAYTATERTKLSGVATAATANATDAQLRDRATHTGTQSADTLTDGTTAKAFLATERTKLTGVATGATANSSDATLLARANHTGTQAAATVTGLATIATSGSAADLAAGTVPTARLGSGTADATTFHRGDGTWASPPTGGGGAFASDKIMYVSPSGLNTNNGLSWSTAKQTLASAITAMSSGGVIEVAGNHTISSALPQPAVGTLIRGQGTATTLTWSATGPMMTLTDTQQIHWARIKIALSNATGVAFRLSNTFLCSWDGVLISGLHNTGTGTTYQGQKGFEFVANAGDNRIINCDLTNLGIGIRSEVIMNFLIGSTVNNCWTGLHITGSDFNPGFSVESSTFQGSAIGAAQVRAHVWVDVEANRLWITNSWFETAQTALQLGTSTGPKGCNQVVVANCHIAATNTCLRLEPGRKALLMGLSFGNDPAANPTEVSINSSYSDGAAINCQSYKAANFPAGTWPTGWTVINSA